jgi:hypothetical protein
MAKQAADIGFVPAESLMDTKIGGNQRRWFIVSMRPRWHTMTLSSCSSSWASSKVLQLRLTRLT